MKPTLVGALLWFVITVPAVSRDSVARLNAFSADPQYRAGKFPVASDPDSAIARSYDLKVIDKRPGMKDTRGEEIDHDFTERTAFIIAPDGRIAATLSSADDNISPADHVDKSLAVVKQLVDGRGR